MKLDSHFGKLSVTLYSTKLSLSPFYIFKKEDSLKALENLILKPGSSINLQFLVVPKLLNCPSPL